DSPALAPLRWCGFRCYSVYLISAPVTHLVGGICQHSGIHDLWWRMLVVLPLAVAASVLAAGAFHSSIERRFLNSPAQKRQLFSPWIPGAPLSTVDSLEIT